MQRFAMSLFTTAALVFCTSQPSPATADPNFDQLRRENLDKDAVAEMQLKAVDFDALRRENLDKDAVDFDQLRRENLDKDGVNFDQLRRENLDKDVVSFN